MTMPKDWRGPGPRVNPSKQGTAHRRGLPARRVQPTIVATLQDMVALAKSQIDQLKAKALAVDGRFTRQDAELLDALYRTMKNAYTLECDIEDRLGRDLGNMTDDQLEAEAAGELPADGGDDVDLAHE